MNVVKNLKPRFVTYLVMNPIRFIRIKKRSKKNNESQKSIVSAYYRTIEKFTQKKCLTISLHLMFIEGFSKKDVICSLLQLTSPSFTLARPRTGSVFASETPCNSDGFEIGFGEFFPYGFLRLQHGPWWMVLVFFLWFETCNMACGRSNFGCPVSRKVSQISTMSSNHSNSPTWKPPNHQKPRKNSPYKGTPFHLSLDPHTNPQSPIKTPPPASTVRSHDFPGTDGGVVLRMRRCGLGVRPGDKPEGPAAAVAVPGCTLAHPQRQSSKLGTPPPPPKSSIPKKDGLENASRFKHG